MVIAVVLVALPVLATPKPANAQWTVLSTKVGDMVETVWRFLDKAVKRAEDFGYGNALNQFVNNLAYNTATKIATGDAGQKPLFYTNLRGVLEDARDVALGKVSESIIKATSKGGFCKVSGGACKKDIDCPFVAENKDAKPDDKDKKNNVRIFTTDEKDSKAQYDELSKKESLGPMQRDRCGLPLTSQFGPIDICNISLDPALEIQIKQITLSNATGKSARKPAARCRYAQVKEKFKNLKNIKTKNLVDVNEIFNQNSNQLGMIWRINSTARRKVSKNIESEKLMVGLAGGFKGKKDPITEKTKTPAGQVKSTADKSTGAAIEAQTTRIDSLASAAFGTFTNTLVAKLYKRIFETGFNPETDPSVSKFSSSLLTRISGIAAARLQFASLLEQTNIYTQDKGAGDILIQLSAGCNVGQDGSSGGDINPDAIRETNNCAIDEKFRQAIERKLTVKEALDEGLLSKDRDFGVDENGDKGDSLVGSCRSCDNSVYPLRSIRILRKYRIVPVGWELAAEYIKANSDTLGRSYGIGELVDDFSRPESPFYRLVDPNWQLKAPISYKERRGITERILSRNPIDNEILNIDYNRDGKVDSSDNVVQIQRGSEEVDVETCVVEKDGSCQKYGYCTEEEPIWVVEGKACEPNNATFDTCQSYTRGDGVLVAYLEKTANRSVCTSEVAGCRRYATIKNEDNEWDYANSSGVYGRGDIYLDRGSRTCSGEDVGCSQFVQLKVLDKRVVTPDEVSEAITTVQALNEGNGGRIGNYYDVGFVAGTEVLYLKTGGIGLGLDSTTSPAICNKEAVGCRLYTPKSAQGPDVPGVINIADSDGYNDECPASCVGYKTYTENAKSPFYEDSTQDFIASTAKQCSARAEGCTEFTNLNEVARGGEGIEYYSELRECITEDDSSAKTFFTWEGSEDAGFQLRTWSLKKTSSGAPAYPDSESGNGCSMDIYNLSPDDPRANPDCREYIDSDLNRYYRLHSKVIFSSAECNLLRRSGAEDEYYAIPSLSVGCAPAEAGCRRYSGNDSGNTNIVFSSTFESGDVDGWGPNDNIESVAESVYTGGMSMRVKSGDTAIVKDVEVVSGGRYIISFLAKGSGDVSATIEGGNGASVAFKGTGKLDENDWKLFELGPAVVSFVVDGSETVQISGLGGGSVIDSITMSETRDLYLIKDSWTTPDECVSPSQLNCEEYEDDKGEIRYLKNFGGICEERFVGCEALINTFNSEFTNKGTYKDVTVPADEIAYVINDSKYSCNVEAKGCAEVGRVSTERDGGDTLFDTQYRIIDPDDFQEILCTEEEEYCDDYLPTDSGSLSLQFKDPRDRVCEYKTNQLIEGRDSVSGAYTVSGWFKMKKNSEPYKESDICQLEGEDTPRVARCNFDSSSPGGFGDPDAQASSNSDECYTYSCPADQSSCREFQDPMSPPGCNINQTDPDAPDACKFYYLLKNSLREGQSSCNSINPDDGCVGFFETSRGFDSRKLRADCQPGCQLSLGCYNLDTNKFDLGNCLTNEDCEGERSVCTGRPVTRAPDCAIDVERIIDPDSKPGCEP